MEKINDYDAARAEALLKLGLDSDLDRFTLHHPLLRFLSVEIDEIGEVVKLNQAETVPEIVKLLELSEAIGTDTEIYDLNSGEALRPDFVRIYRIPRIYRRDGTLYWVTEWDPLTV